MSPFNKYKNIDLSIFFKIPNIRNNSEMKIFCGLKLRDSKKTYHTKLQIQN